ncbi:HTH-type transcriptional regulator RutR [mine drainage metagenome]|uniref:HTH-type transcriptional regulator RutR n=1 Tax=mine drainage metagenome TaxID=410659 RepID=A0A1J5TDA1_9ZZZZ
MVKKKDQTTEEKILAAAKKVFVENGLAGARMQDIADKAGINKALLHYYFRSKEKLFEVIFKEATSKLFPRVSAIFSSDIPLFDIIRQFTNEYVEIVLENPYLPLFVLNEINKQPHAFSQKLFGNNQPPVHKLAEKIEKEIKKGLIKPISPAHLIINMLSMCVFPFVGKPMIQLVMNIDELQFRNMMEQRKTLIADFIIASIKK